MINLCSGFGVNTADVVGVRDLARHLTAPGHRNIAYFGSGGSAEFARERRLGYLEGMTESAPAGRRKLIGAGTSCRLTAQVPTAKALILEAPFKSTYSVVVLGWLPGDRLPNIDRIGKVKFPVLIIHGDRAALIPQRHGRKLFRRVGAPIKRFFDACGAGHNNLIDIADDAYWDTLKAFLR